MLLTWKTHTSEINSQPCDVSCKDCDHEQVDIVTYLKTFQLARISVFPMRKIYRLVCPSCQASYPVPEAMKHVSNFPHVKIPLKSFAFIPLFIFSCSIGIFFGHLKEIQTASYVKSPQVNDIIFIKDTEDSKTPYYFIKINSIDENQDISFQPSKYMYSTKKYAKASVRNDEPLALCDETYEISVDDLHQSKILDVYRENSKYPKIVNRLKLFF